MRVFRALVNVEVVKQRTSETALWKHTLHGMAEDAVNTVLALAQLCRGVETLAAGVSGVAGV